MTYQKRIENITGSLQVACKEFNIDFDEQILKAKKMQIETNLTYEESLNKILFKITNNSLDNKTIY